ncbi:unnamed protein product [Microthlaspi erraticum]|uniref:DUF4283 domain-containing protein n=1 Tax=Microthlaspi erraticum TaxID=1685480 RepID=A0A6D2J0A5_9BRAS|nr:unnamed protein product [Microthlaspi erraticum]
MVEGRGARQILRIPWERGSRSQCFGLIGTLDSKDAIKERRQLRSDTGQEGKWETESDLCESYLVALQTGLRGSSCTEENTEGCGKKGISNIKMETSAMKFPCRLWVNDSFTDLWSFFSRFYGDFSEISVITNGDLVGYDGFVVITLEQYKEIATGRIIVHCLSRAFLSVFFIVLCDFLVVLVTSFWLFVVVQGSKMTQGKLVGNGSSNQGDKKPVNRLKVTVPRFDNTALIQGYSRTLIGRCMNPVAQDVQALLHHMPRFWKMEERVEGADLGMGRFQFDFDKEEDIVEVFKLEPFHFDYWMISLVRWEPVVDPTYPSAIKFWVRMMGIPLHFWAEPTFRSIGEAIGEVIEVDIDGGRVRVCLDGYKPLIFETTVEFYGGDETVVTLRYERLFGVCRECSSLCHDVTQCPVIQRAREERENQKRRDEKPDGGAMSYKGVVINGPGGENGPVRQHCRRPERQSQGRGAA